MMISVRRHYYGHEHNEVDAATNIIHFRVRDGRLTTDGTTVTNGTSGVTTISDSDCPDITIREGRNEYELEDFSERTGF